MRHTILAILLLTTFSFGCRERFDVELKSTDKSLLVVEGFLNNGTAPTVIRLTKTVQLNSPTAVVPVNQAQVSVEAGGGSSITLPFTGSGGYYSAALNLDP